MSDRNAAAVTFWGIALCLLGGVFGLIGDPQLAIAYMVSGAILLHASCTHRGTGAR